MTYYSKHLFLCTNQKAPGKTCCANTGGDAYADYLKKKLIELELHGVGKYRVSRSGCLGRCTQGPCLVIYPDGVWYTYNSIEDLNEIITNQLIAGVSVDRLLLDSEK